MWCFVYFVPGLKLFPTFCHARSRQPPIPGPSRYIAEAIAGLVGLPPIASEAQQLQDLIYRKTTAMTFLRLAKASCC